MTDTIGSSDRSMIRLAWTDGPTRAARGVQGMLGYLGLCYQRLGAVSTEFGSGCYAALRSSHWESLTSSLHV